jgi:xanthine dehydrogenase molybdopterin-binding subunit B
LETDAAAAIPGVVRIITAADLPGENDIAPIGSGEATLISGLVVGGTAPKRVLIRAAGPAVNVLATYNDDPVLVEQGRHLVATFHPELTVDPRVHAYFLTKL